MGPTSATKTRKTTQGDVGETTGVQREQADASNATKRGRKPTTIDQFVTPEWDTLKQMKQNMKDGNDALEYLKQQLYYEDTMEVNLENLSYALMLFSTTSSLRLVQEGARAIALLMRDMSIKAKNEQIEEVMATALTPLVTDLAEIKEELKQLQEQANRGAPLKRQATYANAAKGESRTEGAEIKGRQILIDQDEGTSVNTLTTLTEIQLVAKANTAIEIAKISPAGQELKILSARKLQNGGLLLEANTTEAAKAIKNRKEEFCNAMGPAVKIKDRIFAVRIPFVAVTHEPNSEWERRRIEEISRLEKGHLVATAWVKPTQNRGENQQVATIIARFASPQAANMALKEGIIIQGRRLRCHKTFNGPMRCYHCQRYGHMAINCSSRNKPGRCPACAGAHSNDQCTEKETGNSKCANCNTTGHLVWDPSCPTYKQEVEKTLQKRREAQYKYYPTDEVWTHETDPVYEVRKETRAANKTRDWAEEEEEDDIEEGEVDEWIKATRTKRRRPFKQVTLEKYGYTRQEEEPESEEDQ